MRVGLRGTANRAVVLSVRMVRTDAGFRTGGHRTPKQMMDALLTFLRDPRCREFRERLRSVLQQSAKLPGQEPASASRRAVGRHGNPVNTLAAFGGTADIVNEC